MSNIYNLQIGEDGGADLYIDGEIVSEAGWDSRGVEARAFRSKLARCRDVTVHINSPGGDVFAAAEMYSALMDHKSFGKVTVHVTGIAASAASMVAMAGDKVLMSPVAYMMIHDPWTYAVGNAREMEHQAAVLREIGESIIEAYTRKTGKDRGTIAEMLAAETYMNAQRCVDEGFADGILYQDMPETPAPASAMRANMYGRSAVLARISAPVTPNAQEQKQNDECRRRAMAYAEAILAADYGEE